jgi:hypothetical protein
MGQKQEVILKHIAKKINRLSNQEKALSQNDFVTPNQKFKISRKVFGCFDGFIILRTYSANYQESFKLVTTPERIGVFIKKGLPIRRMDGLVFNLYKLMLNTIGIELKLGSKTGMGVNQGFIFAEPNRFDAFQILISPNSDMADIADTIEDIKFASFSNYEIDKLEKQTVQLQNLVSNSNKIDSFLIITEGKTDWKYFISALRYFHGLNEFENIKESNFLKFGDQEDVNNSVCGTEHLYEGGSSQLSRLVNSIIAARKIESNKCFPLRIGIFDSDDSKIKCIQDNINNVYSIMIEPENISTEFLFAIDDIKQSFLNRRLYIGTEFDSKTKKQISNPSINLGGNNNTLNKAGKNVIIDENIYNQNSQNIALPKEEYAKNIFMRKLPISDQSWEKFRPTFNKLSRLIKSTSYNKT